MNCVPVSSRLRGTRAWPVRSRGGKGRKELCAAHSSVGCVGKGEGEWGEELGRGSQVGEAKLRSEDISGRAAYFSSERL